MILCLKKCEIQFTPIMVLTESINYHVNHIGAIRTNIDNISNKYNVAIVITRERSGEYQKVNITGFQMDFRNVKKELTFVVEQAENDWQDYLKRKEKRNRNKQYQMVKHVKLSSVTEKKTKSNNMFELLNELEDETVYQEEFPEIVYDPSKSWGDQID